MNAVRDAFQERLQEISTYLDLLDSIEKQVQEGVPRLGEGITISARQQRILYSSVYLQLYNLVEATITRCIDALSQAVTDGGIWLPGDLSEALRREWVRFTARTHVDQGADKRLDFTVRLLNHLLDSKAVTKLNIVKGSSGNWDDNAINELAKRLGLPLRVDEEAAKSVKRHHKNDQGALLFIKTTRNNLAHGLQSFAEVGADVTVSELRELTTKTSQYLEQVVNSFERSILEREFLIPEKRSRVEGES